MQDSKNFSDFFFSWLCVSHTPFPEEMLRGRSGEETDERLMSVWRLKLRQFDKIFSYKISSVIPKAGIEYCLNNRIYLAVTNIKGYVTIPHSQPRKTHLY